jgi:hypothetical protein
MGQLVFQATLGGAVNLIGPNIAGTVNFTLPSADGTSGQALSTNGSGTLAFSSFATLVSNTFTGSQTLSAGTANGVTYLNGSKVLTSGSALVFDGTNLGLGVTPSAWNSSSKVVQIGSSGTASLENWNGSVLSLYQNAYRDSTAGQKYLTTAPATWYYQYNGTHVWNNAASGTAGNAITFTQAMTLEADGDWVLGGTVGVDGSRAQIYGSKSLSSGIPQQQLNIGDTSGITTGAGGGISFSAVFSGSSLTTMGSIEGVRENGTSGNYAGALVFKTRVNGGNNNEAARFDSAQNFLVGTTNSTPVDSNVAGASISSLGTIQASRAGAAGLRVNRKTDDGELVGFSQDGTQEGNITVTGTTVSYNGGHLSRYAQTTAPKDNSIVKGTVLSNLDEMNIYTKDGQPVDNEQLNKVKVSDVEGDVNVAGVCVSWSHDEQHNVDEINMAMTGDMIIRIAQGVTVVRGDLLMSAGDGTAKPQGDDIVRSKTVAKVTSNHITCTYADGSYCVPCVLMAC